MAAKPTAVFPGAEIGSTAACWASIRAEEIQGTWELGWYNAATDTWTAIVAISGASGIQSKGVSQPSHTTCKLAVRCTSEGQDDELRCILWCYGVGARVPNEVASQTAAGTATTKAQGVLTTAHDPSDTAGTIELAVTPRLHGGAAPAANETLLELGAAAMLENDGAGHLELLDSTNEANADITETDGTAETVRAAWDSGGLYVAVVGGDDGTASFDGAWPAGDLEVKGSCRSVQELAVYSGANKTTDE